VDQKTGVFIYCCNRILGESIARILTKLPEFRVVMAAASSVSALPESCLPGSVLVLDSLQVLELHQALICQNRREGTEFYPLLVAMEEERQQFLKAIKKGVLGYVLQDASAVDVVAAVRAVAQGEAVCPPRLTRTLFEVVSNRSKQPRNPHSPAASPLTRREQELIPLIGRGLTNKEIAAQLNLSEETIKSHVHRILRKVRAENRRGAFEACQLDLLDLQG
jgi:DNA-binding NarL/FixJ family response regulator